VRATTRSASSAESKLRGLRCQPFVYPFSPEDLLRPQGPVRNGRHGSQDNARLPTNPVPNIQECGYAHQSKVPASPLLQFRVGPARRRRDGRHLNLRENLLLTENVLLLRIDPRMNEELLQGNGALPFRARNLDLRIQGRERRSQVGRVHDVTRASFQNRVVEVLPVDGVANLSSLLQTRERRRPVIPAAGTLAEIPPHGPHIAQLWSSNLLDGLGQNRVLLPHDLMLGKLAQGSQSADPQARGFGLHIVQTGDALQSDNLLGADQILFHLTEEIRPTGHDLRFSPGSSQNGKRVFRRSHRNIRKALHLTHLLSA